MPFCFTFLGTGIDSGLFPLFHLGGERRIVVTIKFFLYTFIGSLLMLAGIIYLSFQMPTSSFAISAITQAAVSSPNNTWLFVLFFIAFAIKMPIFPCTPGSPMPMKNRLQRLPW